MDTKEITDKVKKAVLFAFNHSCGEDALAYHELLMELESHRIVRMTEEEMSIHKLALEIIQDKITEIPLDEAMEMVYKLIIEFKTYHICETRDDVYDLVQDMVFMYAPEDEDDTEEGAIDYDVANKWTVHLTDFFLDHGIVDLEEIDTH